MENGPVAQAETKADIDNYIFFLFDPPRRFRDAEALVRKHHDEFLVLGENDEYKISRAHIFLIDVFPIRMLKFVELFKKHGGY